MFGLSGEQIVEIVKTLPALVLALGSFVAAVRATKRANEAEASAAAAHQKASEAARQQLTFALARAVHDAKTQGVAFVAPSPVIVPLPVVPLPPKEGGASQ